jgi:putative spermidine/putrescine transport system permease protein
MRPGLPRFQWSRVYMAALYGFMLAPLPVIMITSFSADRYLKFPPTGWSLQWYAALAESKEFVASLGVSGLLGIAAASGGIVLGTLAAYSMVRYQFPWKGAVEGLLVAPLVFPQIVLAIALVIYFNQLDIYGTLFGLVLAHVVIGLPYAYRVMSGTLRGVDSSIEEAAQSLGARPIRAFFHVVLPLVRPGMISAFIFVFIISLDEVVVSLFLAGPVTPPLPVRIYTYVEYTVDPTIAAVSTLLMAIPITLGLLAPKQLFGGRRAWL